MNTIERLFPTFTAIKAARRQDSGRTAVPSNIPQINYSQYMGAAVSRSNWGMSWLTGNFDSHRVTDWSSRVGVVGENSLYAICMAYIASEFIQAPLVWQEQDKENNYATVEGDVEMFGPQWLLRNHHPFLPLTATLGATAHDLRRGNAYWLIGRSEGSQPRSLWWFPREWWTVVLSSGWQLEYRLQIPGAGQTTYTSDDVLHFRLPTPDPDAPWIAADPVPPQFRHLCVDNEAGQYTHAVLRNYGVSPVIIAWKDKETRPTEAAIKSAIQKFKERATGENRGEPNILPGDAEVTELKNNPESMALDTILRTPEERVTAALGLNPIALQLGAGLENSAYNNITEANRSAWDKGIAPLHRIVADTLNQHLVPQFSKGPQGTGAVGSIAKGRFFFDYSDIPALQEDESMLFTRANEAFKVGGMTVNELRAMRRQKPLEESDPRAQLMVHELGAPAADTEPGAEAPASAGDIQPNMLTKQDLAKRVPDDVLRKHIRQAVRAQGIKTDEESEMNEVKADTDLEMPAPQPDPHGMAFTDEELDELTDTDNEAAVKLAFAKAGPEARALLGAESIVPGS